MICSPVRALTEQLSCPSCQQHGGVSYQLIDRETSGENVTLRMWCAACLTESAITVRNNDTGCRIEHIPL